MYEDILHLIYRDTNKKLSPAEVVCDFEFSLISSVQRQFPNTDNLILLTQKVLHGFNRGLSRSALQERLGTIAPNGDSSGSTFVYQGNERSVQAAPQFASLLASIANISTSYAQRQASITRGLRLKKQRLPRIELPTAPDLSTFEVPPEAGDDDYEDEEVDLDSFSDAESNKSSNTDDSNEGLTSGNAETAEDILENTDNHDFSLEWEGDESCSESSDSDS
ncbi:unnamed protein product [Phytophthora fragariaefolia]|uniref:Unnamed protein product n=1 Tax=Phytophthora fragariaefolia TaxID=1490495 RepID=A0A9W6YQJ8_9STRA|nr:unnamed protein product [Phytophthora fragariaefolia]